MPSATMNRLKRLEQKSPNSLVIEISMPDGTITHGSVYDLEKLNDAGIDADFQKVLSGNSTKELDLLLTLGRFQNSVL